MINPHEPKYISRRDASIILMVSTNSLLRMEKTGRIPFEVILFKVEESVKRICGYDRKEFLAWAATNPVRHPAFKSEAKRLSRMTGKKQSYSRGTNNEDVYNIRAKRPAFTFSGRKLMTILFCQPALRHGRYTYDDCVE